MENNYYVYVFTNPLKSRTLWYKGFQFTQEPFYVGISKNKYRKKVHFQPSKLKDGSIKSRTISKILSKGLEVGQVILYENLTFKEACDIEIDFIKHYGRRVNKTGFLTNITEGGEGHLGLVHSEKVLKSLYKPLYRFDSKFKLVETFSSIQDAVKKYNLCKSELMKAYKQGFQYRESYWSLTPDKKKKDFFIKESKVRKPRYRYSMYIDGEFSQTFETIEEIDKHFKFKVSRGNISSACSGRIKTYLGYTWKKEKK